MRGAARLWGRRCSLRRLKGSCCRQRVLPRLSLPAQAGGCSCHWAAAGGDWAGAQVCSHPCCCVSCLDGPICIVLALQGPMTLRLAAVILFATMVWAVLAQQVQYLCICMTESVSRLCKQQWLNHRCRTCT